MLRKIYIVALFFVIMSISQFGGKGGSDFPVAVQMPTEMPTNMPTETPIIMPTETPVEYL